MCVVKKKMKKCVTVVKRKKKEKRKCVDSKNFRNSIIVFFYFERFIHCTFNIFRKFERDLNVFETFE